MVDRKILQELREIETQLQELGVLLDTMKIMSQHRQNQVMAHTAEQVYKLAERVQTLEYVLKKDAST